MRLRHCIIILLVIIAANCLPVLAHAQFDEGDPDAWPPEDTNVPFDGGVGILIAAGVAYGLKKRYDNNKRTIKD